MKLLLLCLLATPLFAAEKPIYQNNFDEAEVGKVPDDFLVLDGGFAVRQIEGKKLLELPGAPLETYAVQFGPARSNDVAVAAVIEGAAKGRRFPVFGVGVCGVAGYKLQVSPSKQAIELYRDADLKASAPFKWASGKWLNLRLELRAHGKDAWLIEGKAWEPGRPAPQTAMLSFETKEPPLAGRCSVYGSPFSGEPIRFDDFVVSDLAAP